MSSTISAEPPAHLEAALAAVAAGLAAEERADWVTAMGGPLNRAAITTPRRLAAFVGQCAAETAGFCVLEEDLSYSPDRLIQVWPSHFRTLASAEAYAYQPEVLANCVYAGRMGNGDESSGDGWRFRGRGLIQLTGRATYARFGDAVNMTAEAATDFIDTKPGAATAAAWFWTQNALNRLADGWMIGLLTQRINGGLTGAAQRLRLCSAALRALAR